MAHPSHLKELLAEYGLLLDEPVLPRLEQLGDEVLLRFIDGYRSLYVDERGVALPDAADGIVIWPDHTTTSIWDEKVRAWSLWVDRLYVRDPLLEIGSSEHLRHPHTLLGSPEPLSILLSDPLGELLQLLPFIESGYVSLTAIRLLREPPPTLPITMPPEVDDLPAEFIDAAIPHLRIAAGRRVEGGIAYPPESDLRKLTEHVAPSDILFAGFDDDGDTDLGIWFYAPFERVTRESEGSRTVRARIPMSGQSIEQDVFKAWANQSLNRFLSDRYRGLAQEYVTARALGAELFTSSAANRDLLALADHGATNRELGILEDLRLPALMDVSATTLAGVRAELDSLREFRVFLAGILDRIRSTPGSKDYAREINEALRFLNNDLLPKVREDLSRFQARAALNTTSSIIGGLLAAVVGVPTLEAAAAGAVIGVLGGGPGLISSVADARRSPALIYSKLQRRVWQEGR